MDTPTPRQATSTKKKKLNDAYIHPKYVSLEIQELIFKVLVLSYNAIYMALSMHKDSANKRHWRWCTQKVQILALCEGSSSIGSVLFFPKLSPNRSKSGFRTAGSRMRICTR